MPYHKEQQSYAYDSWYDQDMSSMREGISSYAYWCQVLQQIVFLGSCDLVGDLVNQNPPYFLGEWSNNGVESLCILVSKISQVAFKHWQWLSVMVYFGVPVV